MGGDNWVVVILQSQVSIQAICLSWMRLAYFIQRYLGLNKPKFEQFISLDIDQGDL